MSFQQKKQFSGQSASDQHSYFQQLSKKVDESQINNIKHLLDRIEEKNYDIYRPIQESNQEKQGEQVDPVTILKKINRRQKAWRRKLKQVQERQRERSQDEQRMRQQQQNRKMLLKNQKLKEEIAMKEKQKEEYRKACQQNNKSFLDQFRKIKERELIKKKNNLTRQLNQKTEKEKLVQEILTARHQKYVFDWREIKDHQSKYEQIIKGRKQFKTIEIATQRQKSYDEQAMRIKKQKLQKLKLEHEKDRLKIIVREKKQSKSSYDSAVKVDEHQIGNRYMQLSKDIGKQARQEKNKIILFRNSINSHNQQRHENSQEQIEPFEKLVPRKSKKIQLFIKHAQLRKDPLLKRQELLNLSEQLDLQSQRRESERRFEPDSLKQLELRRHHEEQLLGAVKVKLKLLMQ